MLVDKNLFYGKLSIKRLMVKTRTCKGEKKSKTIQRQFVENKKTPCHFFFLACLDNTKEHIWLQCYLDLLPITFKRRIIHRSLCSPPPNRRTESKEKYYWHIGCFSQSISRFYTEVQSLVDLTLIFFLYPLNLKP